MSPVLKIFVGALMMVLGIFTSINYSNQLINLVLGGIGPLLILLGAFIVWLESDEWKMQRKQKNTQSIDSTGQQTLTQNEENDVENETREAAEEIKQAVSRNKPKPGAEQIVGNRTVNEVKDALQDREDLTAQELLDAERNDQNRKTLVDYLERRVE